MQPWAPRRLPEPCSGPPRPPHRDAELACVATGPAEVEADRGPVGAAACLATTKPMAPWTRSIDMADAWLAAPPGRSSPSRTSCSCTQLSNTRTTMSPLGTLPERAPSHLRPFRLGELVQRASAGPGHVEVLGRTFGTGRAAGARPPRARCAAAKSFFTWWPGPPSRAPARPGWSARSRSRCDSWSLTSQPGHSVGAPIRSTRVTASIGQGTPRLSQGVARPQPLAPPSRRPDLNPRPLSPGRTPGRRPTSGGTGARRDHPPIPRTHRYFRPAVRSPVFPGGSRTEESSHGQLRGLLRKCREKREFDGQEVEITKNGRRAAQGTCPVCGTKMNRILGKAKV